jgi:hypothetical protein
LERFNMDLEDLYAQIAEDEKLKAKYGIQSDFGEAVGKLAQQPAAPAKPEDEGGENNE